MQDTGVGISEEFLPYIFDEFKQESYGISRSYEGTGLGLTITKKLVDQMNGSITVQSELDVGTVFTVMLPEPRESSHQLKDSGSDVSSTKSSSSEAVETNGQNYVLMVEDNVDSRFIMEQFLKTHYETETAASPEKALELISKQEYEAILLDINLGAGSNGFEILEAIRESDFNSNVPVIAVTAFAMKTDRDNFEAAGFDGFLPKPLERRQLLGILDNCLKSA